MILIDDRQGSKHLLEPLEKAGIETKLDRLDFADVAFDGLGENREPITCGIEIKQINEIVDDLVRPRFTGHQLPGMIRSFNYSWLLVQGPARANPFNGLMEVPRGKAWKQIRLGPRKIPYATFWKHLHTISLKAGINLLRAYTKTEVVWQIVALYRWWEMGWDEHHSHERRYRRPLERIYSAEPMPLVRRMAAELSSIGRVRSKAVAEYFPTPWHMVCATEEEWLKVDGIGKETARRVIEELEGR